MTVKSSVNRRTSLGLPAEIRNAAHQLSIQQRCVDVRAAIVIRKIHKQMTAPTTLILASAIGFMFGELTQCPRSDCQNSVNQSSHKMLPPLTSVLKLLISVHTLYTALPVAWKILPTNKRPPGT
ncbi:MAG: hypothetical protein HOP23_00930 [Methylococcaceae bacterium]|nr:hypothetical protein [Methylococcaceae bacterium]